jgi:tetratricopeptide repeat protein 8
MGGLEPVHDAVHGLVAGCRYVRLGTASLAASGGAGGPFIKPERLDMRKYAARPNLARVLCDYIIYVV